MIINKANRFREVKEYYFSKKLREIRKMQENGIDVLNLGIGSPDLAPHASVVQALNDSANKSTSHAYQAYKGIAPFRKAIADHLERDYKIKVDPETEVLPLMGSKEGVMHISMAFLNEGDKVLVPNPGYPTYSNVSKMLGAELINYNLLEEKDWQLDIETLKKLPLDKVKLMWINTPNMPTGVTFKESALAELIRLAKQHQFLIINDNPYSRILTDKVTTMLTIEGARDVVLELNSLSKSHNMAGWRVGWVVGREQYIAAILQAKSNFDSGMFLSVQEAAIRALMLSDSWFDELNRVYSERKALIKKLLDELDCRYSNDQTGLFLWSKIPHMYENCEAFADHVLEKYQLFVSPGNIFGSQGARFIRISLCSNSSIIEKAIERVQKVKLLKV